MIDISLEHGFDLNQTVEIHHALKTLRKQETPETLFSSVNNIVLFFVISQQTEYIHRFTCVFLKQWKIEKAMNTMNCNHLLITITLTLNLR